MKSQTYFVQVPSETTWKLPGFLTRNLIQTGGASYCQVYCRSKRCSLWQNTTLVAEQAAVYGSGTCPMQNSAN